MTPTPPPDTGLTSVPFGARLPEVGHEPTVDASDDVVDESLRCSVRTRRRGSDPTGTATAADAFLLVELPLPWPKDIADHPLLQDLGPVMAATGRRIRTHGVVPRSPERTLLSIVAHQRPPGAFRSYLRTEAHVDLAGGAAAVAAAAATVLADVPTPGQPPAGARGPGSVLICTHGRRDRCCGAMGTNLFTEAAAAALPGRHVERVSHLGGHRFAPTALFLPEGHLWAWLDLDLVASIAARAGAVEAVLPHYRGSAGIGSAPIQVCERAVFALEGWSWLDASRSGRVVEQHGDRWHVRIDVERADGSPGAYEGIAAVVDREPQPICGQDAMNPAKSDPVWVLEDLRAVAPAATRRAGPPPAT